MYTDFAIRNFRGIRELSIEGLERLTLVSGRNDSGKTTLLEALFFHGGGDPQVTFALDQLRGIITGGLEMSGSDFPNYACRPRACDALRQPYKAPSGR